MSERQRPRAALQITAARTWPLHICTRLRRRCVEAHPPALGCQELSFRRRSGLFGQALHHIGPDAVASGQRVRCARGTPFYRANVGKGRDRSAPLGRFGEREGPRDPQTSAISSLCVRYPTTDMVRCIRQCRLPAVKSGSVAIAVTQDPGPARSGVNTAGGRQSGPSADRRYCWAGFGRMAAGIASMGQSRRTVFLTRDDEQAAKVQWVVRSCEQYKNNVLINIESIPMPSPSNCWCRSPDRL